MSVYTILSFLFLGGCDAPKDKSSTTKETVPSLKEAPKDAEKTKEAIVETPVED